MNSLLYDDTTTNDVNATNHPTEHSNILHDRYQAGERDFSDSDFGDLSLSGGCLSYATLRRSKLRQIDLQQADLRGINLSEANLSQSNLQNTDLRGATLNSAMLFMAGLDGANLQGADLSGASLDISTLNQANLQGANLCGTYLCGIDLSQACLQGAYFNEKTQFDACFDPIAAGMRNEINLTLDDLLAHFNQVSKCASRYLGNSMTSKYWEKSRWDNPYLAAYQIDALGKFSYTSSLIEPVNFLHLQWTQLWLNQFISYGSMIFQDLPDILTQKELLVISTG
jgi:uncharacterized protein YjbI with pentapeptide repeats